MEMVGVSLEVLRLELYDRLGVGGVLGFPCSAYFIQAMQIGCKSHDNAIIPEKVVPSST
jgi:hypothetical protein